MVRRRALRSHRPRWPGSALPGVSPRRRRGHRGLAPEPAPVAVFLRATDPAELSHLDEAQYAGVSLGAEFCARRLPAPGQVRDAVRRCRDRGLPLALVTPLAREGALDDVTRWLSALAPHLEGAEWSCNDWGLLHWAREQGLPLRPVAGRLLSRQRRDPRVLDLLHGATPEDARGLRGSVWDDPETAALLTEFGVGRVELDLLVQGVRMPALPPGVALSLCGPWVPVTVAPSCPWTEDPLHCPLACQSAPAARQRSDESPRPLYSRGNALFLRLDDVAPGRALAAAGADRLVWSPEIPG